MAEIDKDLQEKFLKELLQGNRIECSSIVKLLFKKDISIKIIYEDLFKTALYEVGKLWEFNKISVATEHLASAIIESLLNENYLEIISNTRINKNVMLSCVEKEHHQIGIKMVDDIFQLNGWSTYFLGSNTPTNDVLSFAKTIDIDLIAISLSIYSHLPELIIFIEKFRELFPETLILVGGQAFVHGGKTKILEYYNVIYLKDLNSTEEFIKKLNSYE